MLLRLLLALSVVVTGAGLAAPPGTSAVRALTPAASVIPEVLITAADGAAPDEVGASSAPLVIASEPLPEADATEQPDVAARTALIAEPSPTVSPVPSDPGTAGADAPATVTEDEAAQATVDPTQDSVVADALTEDGRVLTPAVETPDVHTIGVTWPEGADAADLEPQVRTLMDGEWTAWAVMPLGDEEPDAGTADSKRAVRGGTDAFWIGDAEAVQLSFVAGTDDVPADMSLALISESADAPGATAGEAEIQGAVLRTAASAEILAAATAPTIVTRAQWGARAPACTPDVASKLSGAVVHHTAGSNNYTPEQAKEQIRGDQAYHIVNRGWCDIGYNFVVDKYGTIYEGRANSLTQAVIGVHASGANTGTVGVSMLGNYDITPTTPAMIDAVGRIIGWRLGAYGVDPYGSGTFPSGLTMRRIQGHRDVPGVSTACPGRYGYQQMDNIRAVAAANLGSQPMPASTARAIVKALYQDLLGRAPDAAGLASWSNALQSGLGQPSLVEALTSSEEYVRLRVSQAYQEVLGRAPEASGLQYWRDRIFSGQASVDDVKRRFYDSQEYYNRSGGTPQGYVDLLYRTMFDRAASANEATYWSGQIGVQGRSKVVDSIWFSTEAAMWRAGKYYETFLRRTAEWSGRVYWAGILQRSGEGAVRMGIAGSTEYRNLAIKRFPA